MRKVHFFLMVCTRSMGGNGGRGAIIRPYTEAIYIGKRRIVQRVLCRKRKKKKEIAVLFRKDLRPPLAQPPHTSSKAAMVASNEMGYHFLSFTVLGTH